MQTVCKNTIFYLKPTVIFQIEIRGIKWQRVAGQEEFAVDDILKIDFNGKCFRLEGAAMNM